MSDAWATAAEMAEKHTGGGLFLRLADDEDKFVGVFLGVPKPREVYWTGTAYVDAESPEAAQFSGKKPSFRASINVFVLSQEIGGKQSEVNECRIFDMNNETFKGLMKVRDKYGLDKWCFEVERKGKSGDPKTKYPILPERELTAAEKKQVTSAELLDLDGPNQDQPKVDQDTASRDVFDKIMPRLKVLPKSAVNEFLGAFKIERIRDLHPKRDEDALAFLAQLEAQHTGTEVDPFA